jgi:hypothetical protein
MVMGIAMVETTFYNGWKKREHGYTALYDVWAAKKKVKAQQAYCLEASPERPIIPYL